MPLAAGDRLAGTLQIIIRDNRRVLGNLAVRAFLLFLKKAHRRLWPDAMRANYTAPEAKELVKSSKMRGARVGADYVRLDICVEAFRND